MLRELTNASFSVSYLNILVQVARFKKLVMVPNNLMENRTDDERESARFLDDHNSYFATKKS